MCSAPKPKAPPPIVIPKLPKPPPPPPVPVVMTKQAAVIRKTAIQRNRKLLASRGPSQLRIPLAQKKQ